MDIRAAEISAILKQQIENFGTEADVAEVGQVLSVGDGVARVYGLDNVQAGEMVEFPGGIRSTYYGWAYLAESSSVIAGQFLVAALTVAVGGLATAILWLQLLALPSLAIFWSFVPETLGRDLDAPPQPPAQ